jgi:DNA repair protein RadC
MPTFTEGPQLALPFPAPNQPVIARDATGPAYTDGSAIRRALVIPVNRAIRTAIKDWPRADRPRDKLLDRGPGVLSDAELLSILFRTGAAEKNALDQARAVMEACEYDWRRLAVFGAGDLSRLAGLSPTKAAVILAVLEIAKRYGEHEFKPGEPLRGSADVYAHFRERLATETREHFVAVLLDNKHRKIKDVVLSIGSLTASIVHPRDAFALVVREAPAAAVVFVHNHPSGDPTPSKEDIEITRRLREAGEIMGIRVLDHIIIGRGRHVSFVD